MLDLESFRKEDGLIDWAAYNSAKKSNGDICCKCGDHRLFKGIFTEEKSGLWTCHSCKRLDNRSESVTHDTYIRCPKCGETWDGCEDYEILSEGSHDVYCPSCDHNFEVEVRVSYSFTSPGVVEDE